MLHSQLHPPPGSRTWKGPASPARPRIHARGRWQSATTDRLNSGHWSGTASMGSTINEDIGDDMPTIRQRCRLELANNPLVEGMVDTYTTDLIGPNGPTLHVESDDPDYNTALEQIWREWWKLPDVNRQLSGVELLEIGLRNCWTCGEFLQQILADDRTGPIKFGLLDIDPARLDTPIDAIARDDIQLGIELAPPARPVAYHFLEVIATGAYAYQTGRAERIRAEYIVHWFRRLESDQRRGVAWLAVALPAIADLRDFDVEVLDTARAAADTGQYLYADHPDAPYIQVNESVAKERRQTETLPPGWKPFQMQPMQPAAAYVPYRQGRQLDLGRSVSMPLMITRLDSSEHNYSSARFDGQKYQRGIERTQGRISTGYLSPMVGRVGREAELVRELPPAPPRVELAWVFAKAPHVDPGKEATAIDTRLGNLTLSLADALAADGKDLDAHMHELKRTDRALRDTLGIGLIEYVELCGRSTARTNEPDDDAEGGDDGKQETKDQKGAAAGTAKGRNGHYQPATSRF